MKRLTLAQCEALKQIAVGGYRVSGRSRSGDVIRRMLNAMKAAGFIEGPPWTITEKGREALPT